MSPQSAPAEPLDEGSSAAVPERVSGRLVGRLGASVPLGSVLAVVILIAGALAAATFRQPPPSEPPAGAVGIAPPPGPTEPLESWIAIGPSPEPSQTGDASANPSTQSAPSALATPWRTSQPSECQPYIKACDPSIMPTYPYVAVIVTTGGSTDADLGVGKVIVVAAGHSYSCSTYSTPSSCYYEVPPGMAVTATAYNQAGSICTYFELMWEDYASTIRHDDCSPISFTTKTQKAQLVANFDRAPTAPPVTPPPPPTAPPATEAPAPTAAPTLEDTPVPT